MNMDMELAHHTVVGSLTRARYWSLGLAGHYFFLQMNKI